MASLDIRLLHPGDEPALENFLRPRLASSLFLLGNMRKVGLEDKGDRYHGTYAAVLEDDQIMGVAAHFWNGNIILQSSNHVESLVEAVAGYSGRAIRGLIGPYDQVLKAKASLVYEDGAVQMDSIEWLFQLELNKLVIPEDLESGRLKGRRVRINDVDLITEWRIAYEVETLGATVTPQLQKKSRQGVLDAVKAGETWLLEADGRIVSMTGFNVAMTDVVQVGGVYTPPELRRRGYARAAVVASLLDARAESVEMAILFTQIENIPAQKAYKAIGFRRIGTYCLLLFRQPARLAT